MWSPLPAWTLLRSVLKVKKVAYFLSEVNKGSKCWCVEHLLLGAVDYQDLRFWSCKVWHQYCQGWQWGQMQLWGLLKVWGIQDDARTQRCGKPKDAKVHMGQSLWVLKVLWGHSFAFVGFCHLLLFCGRFLTPLVSLHTFHRPSTSRKCMNSQKADLSMPITQRGWWQPPQCHSVWFTHPAFCRVTPWQWQSQLFTHHACLHSWWFLPNFTA